MKKNRSVNIIIFIFSALLFISTMPGCLDPPLELTQEEKVWIDTLVVRQTKVLRPYLDSICDEHMDVRVQFAVDSILEIRLKEIEELLNRN